MILFPPILISLIYFFDTVPPYLEVHPSNLFYINPSSLPGHFVLSLLIIYRYYSLSYGHSHSFITSSGSDQSLLYPDLLLFVFLIQIKTRPTPSQA
nr:MAG TPA: hypothetical protein [Caudoviricetes sp.]